MLPTIESTPIRLNCNAFESNDTEITFRNYRVYVKDGSRFCMMYISNSKLGE